MSSFKNPPSIVKSNLQVFSGPARGRLWRRQHEVAGICRSCGLRFMQKGFSNKICDSCKFDLEFSKDVDLNDFL